MGNYKPERKKKQIIESEEDDFDQLYIGQDRKCALTGRELTLFNLEVERRDPFKKKGAEELENHYLIIKPLSYFARHNNEESVIKLAAEIIKYRGKEFGFRLLTRKK